MIKAEELMIGDWVFAYGKKAQVVWTSNIKKLAVRGFPNELFEDEILPIPIIPEILEKNGFYWGYPVDVEEMASNVFGGIGIEMPPKSWVWDEGEGVVSVIFPNESDGGMITCYLNKHLTLVFNDMFVHELQHALKLCGISKTIEL